MSVFSRIFPSTNFSKLLELGKLVTITGGAQIIIQAIGFLSGILIIRTLSTQEYAFYTIANTTLGTLAVLADGGISLGVMALGGKVWQKPEKLGAVLVTGISLRKRFAFGSLLITIPLLFYLLRSNHASWLMCIVISFSIIPAFLMALSGTILEVVPKLHQSIVPLQKIQLSLSFMRLSLLSTFAFVFPYAYVAILAAGIPQLWSNSKLRKLSLEVVDFNQLFDINVEKDLLKIVKRVLPGSIYFSFSGQITVWLLSIMGTTNSIAQIGALGRLNMVFTLFFLIYSFLVLPRFARYEGHTKKVMQFFFTIIFGTCLIVFFISAFLNFFSVQCLWVLGNKYANLNKEFFICVIMGGTRLILDVVYSLTSSKGVIINSFFNIFYNLVILTAGILLFKIDTLNGVLYLSVFVNLMEITLHFSYGIMKMYNCNN